MGGVVVEAAVAADTEGVEGTDTSSDPAAVTRDQTISGGVVEAAAVGDLAGVAAVTGQ